MTTILFAHGWTPASTLRMRMAQAEQEQAEHDAWDRMEFEDEASCGEWDAEQRQAAARRRMIEQYRGVHVR
jgi:hypothetical protein